MVNQQRPTTLYEYVVTSDWCGVIERLKRQEADAQRENALNHLFLDSAEDGTKSQENQ
jgi:hypothetical protein